MQAVHLKKIFLLFLFWLTSTSLCAEEINIASSIAIENIKGHGLEIKDIVIDVDSLLKKESTYHIQIGSVILPENKGVIKDIQLHCFSGSVAQQEITCEDGNVSFNDPLVRAEQSKFRFNFNQEGVFDFTINDFELAKGRASLTVSMYAGNWQANLISKNVSLANLNKMLPEFLLSFTEGKIDAEINLSGNKSSLLGIKAVASLKNFSFSNSESTTVGEDVSLKLALEAKRHNIVWQSKLNASVHTGELYLDPVFLDANQSIKDVYGNIEWHIGSNEFELSNFHFVDQGTLHAKLFTLIDYTAKSPIGSIKVDVRYALFPNVYKKYIQPFLLDTNLADLKTKGYLAGEIMIVDERIAQAKLNFNNLSFIDNQNRFSMINLDADFGWGENYINENYIFKFDFAEIYKLRFESSKFSFAHNQDRLGLKQPVKVPILDGAVNVETFNVLRPGKVDQSITMDISLTPISMPKLSDTFGWPDMNGNLAGYAPNVSYKNGDITVQGALLLRGFGGTTTIHNLSANDLFSVTPKLSADIKFNNLDLRAVTETFSFGEITGNMSGSIEDLELISWAPVGFDAWFGTPENDQSRHRISQTAVDNLTQVGNGASNILSKSFLSFFDSFGYSKLGLGCRLKNNICKMRGVEEFSRGSSQGFYIVKGSGVPRIDIVGFTEEVSWPVLTARLKRVVSTKDVIVN